MKFKDRSDAGIMLAGKLTQYKNNPYAIVLGMARGGMLVAEQIAQALALPLDVKIVQKIESPSNPLLVIGALTASGTVRLNKSLMEHLGLDVDTITPNIETAKKEAMRRLKEYCDGRVTKDVKDKTVILVDDIFFTDELINAAIESVKLHGAQRVIVAVPVAPAEIIERLTGKVDETVCLQVPELLITPEQFYETFSAVSDDEIISIMNAV